MNILRKPTGYALKRFGLHIAFGMAVGGLTILANTVTTLNLPPTVTAIIVLAATAGASFFSNEDGALVPAKDQSGAVGSNPAATIAPSQPTTPTTPAA